MGGRLSLPKVFYPQKSKQCWSLNTKKILYRTKSSETKTKLETLLAYGQQLLAATMSDPNLRSQMEIQLLKYFLIE